MRFLSLLVLAFSFSLLSPLSSQSPAEVVPGSHSPKILSRGPEKGTLLIIGGGASDLFYEKFMELVGGAEAPIVVIPTAMTSDSLTISLLLITASISSG